MSTAQTLADAVSALNNVATSHEQLNATMTAQQDVVEANFKALQDFATHPDTATFKDKNGTSFPVKSLRKLAADAEAVNPNPHVMTKAEFDALREMRKQQYAGSGFVEWGKHPNVFENIDGLWFYTGSGWENKLALGSDKPSSDGKSHSNYAQVLVDGVLISIENIRSDRTDESTFITLPPAPDGTKTYDSATGIVTQNANAEVAFASETETNKVILSRKDLVFLEVWHEKISEKDVIYPLGNVQFGASSWSSVTLSNALVAQGYSAFGEWDSNTKGYGVRWSSLSEANRNKFLSDPANNIYFDADLGDYVQVRYRVRVVEGYDDQWNELRPSVHEITTEWAISDRKRITFAQGLSQNITSKVFVMKGHTQTTDTKLDNGVAEGEGTTRGLLSHGQTKPLAIPIALVQRMNQGAYHPELNPFGCSQFTQVNVANYQWYNLPDSFKPTVVSCFSLGTRTTIGKHSTFGSVSSNSGRLDYYKYHDAIYAGQVEDLRLSAKKQDVSQLLASSAQKAISGALRGKGKSYFTQFKSLNKGYFVASNLAVCSMYSAPTTQNGSLLDLYGQGFKALTPVMVWQPATKVTLFGRVSTSNGHFQLANQPSNLGRGSHIQNLTALGLTTTDICYFAEVTELSPEFDVVPHIDLIGDPDNIAVTFPQGVAAQWIPFASNIVPPQGVKYFETNQIKSGGKLNSGYECLKSVDNGKTWKSLMFSFNNTDVETGNYYYLRESTHTIALDKDLESNAVVLVNYGACSHVSVAAENSVIKCIGEINASSHSSVGEGNRLSKSLANTIGKASTDPAQGYFGEVRSYRLKNELLDASMKYAPTHGDISIGQQGNQSPMVKLLSSVIQKNGLYYLQFNGTELKHNGTDWGDDQTIPIINGEDVKTDLNGNTVKVFCHHSVYPLGIAHND
ncbi:hypothetical protein [Pseudoalteromonas xiamenensis]